MSDLNDGMDRSTGEQVGPANVGVLAARINEDHDALSAFAPLATALASPSVLTGSWSDGTAGKNLASLLVELGLVDDQSTFGTIGDPGGGALSAYATAVLALEDLARFVLLNETEGVTAFDVSGAPTGQNGTYSATGVTYGATDSVALASQASTGAVILATATGIITFPHDPIFNLSTIPSRSWTIILDVGDIPNRTDDTLYCKLFKKGNSSSNGFEFTYDPHYHNVLWKSNGKQYATDPDDTPLSTMQQVAITWNGATTKLSFYYNASLIPGQEYTVTGGDQKTITDAGPMQIGGTTAADGGFTAAKLVVVDAALTAGQLQTLYATLHGTVAPPPTPGGGATLIWSDEFNGSAGASPDTGTNGWTILVGAASGNRLEYNRTQNAILDGNGNLQIIAKRESFGGRQYTSARLEGKRPIQSGYVEWRANTTVWPGTCPALWLFGASGSSAPATSLYSDANHFIEVDVVEEQTGGSFADPTHVKQTIHSDLSNHSESNLWQLGWNNNKPDFSPNRPGDAFHTYGVWIDGTTKIVYYVDGVVKATYNSGSQPSGGQWPFGVSYQVPIMEVNLGFFSGTPDGSTNQDVMLVDYFRVYDKPPY